MAGERILIVEDESIVAMDIQARLENLGYVVAGIVSSGVAAVAQARDGKPDMILMDIMLEGELDGIQTAVVIRQQLQIPVIFLTAYADGQTIERAKLAEPLGFIHKPLDLRELFSVLEMALYKNRMDRQLRDSENRYKRLLESVTDYIFTVKVENGRAVSTTHNPTCLAVTGYSLEEYQSDPDLWFKMVPLEDRPQVLEQARRLLSGEPVQALEHRLFHKSGALIWVRNTPVPHYDEKGRLVAYDGLVSNITERKRSEEALRESEEKYRMLSEQSLAGIQIIKDRRLIFVNDGWSRITGYSRAEALAWNADEFLKVIHEDDRAFCAEQIVRKQAGLTEGVRPVYDCRFRSKDGATKWVLINSKGIQFADGLAIVVLLVDITDRKLAEQALAEANRLLKASEERLKATNQELSVANREKEALLKEVHHRVKNNLQVVSSLLNLQLGHVRDTAACTMIRECQNRIRAIAIAHEKLYQFRNLDQIEMDAYLQSLVSHLFRTFMVKPGAIRVNLAAQDVALDIEQAIPCCLIINELLTNALKYAFPDDRPGEISVSLKAASRPAPEGRNYMLVVGDSGVGFPAGMDFRNTSSLGMQLVMTFVEQLGGTITLADGPGAVFTVRFSGGKAADAPVPSPAGQAASKVK